MHVILATDDNFVQHCCVTITSMIAHNKGVNFYIFTEGLTKENEEILKKQAKKNGCHLEICIINDNITKSFPMPPEGGLHISIATYYRLFAAIVLPETVDKVIYMDCDMVVRKSFEDLWYTDLTGYALGAVFQNDSESSLLDKERLMIEKNYGYFNAGLLFINLDYWRKNDVTKRLFDFIRNHRDRIKQHDQDTLNAVLYKEVKPISYTWNYLPIFYWKMKKVFPSYVDYTEKVADPANIHFVSVPKPWDFGCTHPYRKEYYKYLEMTPFKGTRPKLVWKKFYKDVLKRNLILFIAKIDVFNIRKLVKS